MGRISQSEQRVFVLPGVKALAEPNRSSRRLPLGNDAENRKAEDAWDTWTFPSRILRAVIFGRHETRMRACWRIVDFLRGSVRTSSVPQAR